MVPAVPLFSSLPSFINSCIEDLTPGNLSPFAAELLKLGDLFGSAGRVCLLKTLLSKVDFLGKPDWKALLVLDLVRFVWQELSVLPNFGSIVAQSLPTVPPSDFYLEKVVKHLNLSSDSQAQLYLAACQGLTKSWRSQGLDYLTAFLFEVKRYDRKVISKVTAHSLLCVAYLHPERFSKEISWIESKAGIFKNEFSESTPVEIQFNSIIKERHLELLATMGTEMLTTIKVATVMQELGYACTAHEQTFKVLLSKCGTLSEYVVAEALSMMVRTYSGLSEQSLSHSAFAAVMDGIPPQESSPANWNFSVFVEGVKSAMPFISWAKVMELLDHSTFVIPDQQAFMLLISTYRRATSEPFPLKAFITKPWVNVLGQLSFLKFAVAAPPEIFSFESSEKKQAPLEGLHGGKSPHGTANHAWLSLDLLDVLCNLAESGHAAAVRQLLDYPTKHCPEVLLTGIAAVASRSWLNLQSDVRTSLLPTYLGNHPNSLVVVHRLWACNRLFLLQGFVDYYEADTNHISRILDLCQELKALGNILESTPHSFAIELAALASRREYLNLEKWLNDHIVRDGYPFVTAVLRFLDQKTAAGAIEGGQPGKINLALEPLRTFLKVLQANANMPQADINAELRRVIAQASRSHPALYHLAAANALPESFPSDVEEEANSYFQKIYSEQKPVEEVIARLKAFKASPSPREQEVFACMVHNLFDEYQYFHRYPEKELAITAVLFGSLVHHQLVSSITLGIALRYVLDALKKPLGTKMFNFGHQSLKQFASSIQQWPQFCAHVLSGTHIREADPALYARIEAGLREAQVAAGVGETVVGMSSGDMGVALPSGVMLSPAVSSPLPSAQPPSPTTDAPVEIRQPFANGLDRARLEPPAPIAAPSVVPVLPSVPVTPEIMPPALVCPPVPMSQPPAPIVPPGPVPRTPPPQDRALSSMDAEVDRIGSNLAAQVAASSLAAPREAPSLTSTVNTETLETAAAKFQVFQKPPDAVADKIHFFMNNVSKSNVATKAGEIRERLSSEHFQWFCDYMVVKRAAQEPNYQDLYVQLVDAMDIKELYKLLVKTSICYIKVILDSDRIQKDSNERSLLKNLGIWLGLLTFAKNKPLLANDLDLKKVTIDAYVRGRLIAVLPFVKTVLDSCKGSKVFKPSNPMVASILALMAELHTMKGLRLTVMFTIELAFKIFDMSPSDLKPVPFLRDLERERVNNMDWGIEQMSVEASPTPAVTAEQQRLIPLSPSQTINSKLSTPPQSVAAPQSVLGTSGATPGVGGPQSTATANAAAAAFMSPSPRASGASTDLASKLAAAAAVASDGSTPQTATAGSAPQVPPAIAPPAVTEQTLSLMSQLHNYVAVNVSLGPMAERLHLKRIVPAALERAISEIIKPVVERSVTIACYTSFELVIKDFALEPDEQRMRKAAHLMVSSLAGSLALVTCRDPLRASFTSQLRTILGSSGLDTQMLEQVVQVVVNDNLELGCNIIERDAMENAQRDIDKSLQPHYEARQKAEAMGRIYYDQSMFHGRFPASLPESLRPRPGHMLPAHQRVYEDFARIPRSTATAAAATLPGAGPPPLMLPTPLMAAGTAGTAPVSATPAAGAQRPFASAFPLLEDRPGEVGRAEAMQAHQLEKYIIWQGSVDAAINKGQQMDETELRALVTQLGDLVATSSGLATGGSEDSLVYVAKRILRHLYDAPATKLHVSFHVHCLDVLSKMPGGSRLPVELATQFGALEDERKWSQQVGEALVGKRLLALPELDSILARAIAASRTPGPLEFLVHVMKNCMITQQLISLTELYSCVETVVRMAPRMPAGDTLMAIIEAARAKTAHMRVPCDRPVAELPAAVRDRTSDPPGLREQAASALEDWLRAADEKAQEAMLTGLRNTPLLMAMDEVTDRFLRVLIELAAGHAVQDSSTNATSRPEAPAPLSYLATDGLVRLIASLCQPGAATPAAMSTALLSRFLAMIVGNIKKESDERSVLFNARPYARIMVGLMHELIPQSPASAAAVLSKDAERILSALATALHALQPLTVPGFAFAWMELVSHRLFMPPLLASPGGGGWALYEALLVALLRFLEPHLRSGDLVDSVRALYKGCLRLLLVLLHDFPEFLCAHHVSLCDAIPACCIQMRNLILSAFPRNMRLPDPFTPNLKVDLLPEIAQPPQLTAHPEKVLPEALRYSLEEYLASRTPPNFIQELAKALTLPPSEARAAGCGYHVPLINALVLHIGSSAKPGVAPLPNSPPMDVFCRLATELDSEGRYLLLNAIANQLRYPNSHTHYFSCVLLFLFTEARSEVVQEQITRVLLERLIVNRPHPWGLLITFIELIKNPRYSFWSHSFTRCTPEIERLFESVARSCMVSTVGKLEEETPKENAVASRA